MHFVFLVEEPSMEAFLRTLLPRLLREACTHQIHAFQGKRDLKWKLKARLRGYARWLPDDWRIFVLVDRDRDDCRVLKNELEETARLSGLRTISRSRADRWQVANRIVIEELESWYFGDWEAVRRAYPRVSPNVPKREGYRDPDGVRDTWEAFERVLQRHGYFSNGLRKTEAARAVAKHVDPAANRSASFAVFHRTLMEAAPAAS